jgi:hypothetical protein
MVSECKNEDARNRQLTILMNNLEREYDIPAYNDEAFNVSNPGIMDLYRAVSTARNL